MKCLVFIFCSFLLTFSVVGQGQEQIVRATVSNGGDTLVQARLTPHNVVGKRKFRSQREERKYYKLQKKVVKVYPNATLAAQKLELYASQLEGVESRKAEKKFYKKIEKELKAEYEGELRRLTVTEGAILIKLIDRETGSSSYALVQDFRGDITAFFWQGLAKMFGQNLKNEYDPNGADKEIEQIVRLIEAGAILLN
jgi:hypothetical protein